MLVLDPGARFHLREIARRAGTSAGTASRELARLQAAGLVSRTLEGRQLYFRAVTEGAVPRAVAEIVRQTMGAHVILRAMLSDVAGLESARIFGSYAAGRATSASDIDLLVIGSPDRDVLTERLEAAGRQLGRPVNEVVYTAGELEARRERGDAFVHSIDAGEVLEVLP